MRRTARNFFSTLIVVTAFATMGAGAQNLATSSSEGSVVSLPASNAVPLSIDSSPSSAGHPYFHRFVDTGSIEYGVANNEGVYVSLDSGKSWQLRDSGLPERMVYPFDSRGIETITAIGVDPLNPNRVAITTSIGLYVSTDAGVQWKEIQLREPIRSVAYITAVAVSPWSAGTYAVGTSFSGLFETSDGGRSWTSYSDSLKFLYKGAGFYEEVAGLSYSPVERGVIFLGAGFGGNVYRSNADKSSWSSTAFPVGKASDTSPMTDQQEIVRQLTSSLVGGKPLLLVATRSEDWSYDLVNQSWTVTGKPASPPPISAAKRERIAEASDRSGLYLAAVNASGERLQEMIRLAKANGLNSFVVDVKDDFGRLTYNSQLPLAEKVGSIHPLFNLSELIKVAHENGIYVVGRMVVFKDEKLFSYDNYKYAIWDKPAAKPWRNLIKTTDQKTGDVKYIQREYWVDPFSEAVWQYNVDIAKELQSLGIDEIQFDYIRFPSDGPLANAEYRFKRQGMSRIDALESFMVMARAAIHIPISTDLYGFNCWYRMGNWIGQNTEMLANYVDVVCPMYYPSLFPSGFMEKVPYLDRAKDIYDEGTRRAQEIVRGRSVIRPFVQAFLLLSNELNMDTPQYSEYLRMQLGGAQDGHSSGFTLWNARNDYYMITFPLTPYVTDRPKAVSQLD